MKIKSRPKLLAKVDALDIINRNLESHSDQMELLEKVQLYCKSSMSRDDAARTKQILIDMGLTEFESIQLLDFSPKSIVCLQLVVEDMEERFTDEDLFRILNLFNNK
ncbi:DNA-DIRECTED RNA POLYMERASE II 16kDa POLYPEPTIDE [Encephalitozoon cuniculi GB-M1]|uniref:DNA-DIRECTED RNA POLYMERASE II 16kDa POLYPEPTIDE n=2 Tax=Encephalitozoon cuniculi TaxID=6035 RepID=Q8SRV8_ENCCU|nr:RNA pol Rpb4 domain-containing protein [Encephalitozoon cuniculi GB-M1]AGE95493.1 DNA-directed RNA polymerase II 16kDa polypeptide [Encephalitozoon cuniculi]KMV66163.1 RNA pol Rpb4 domain-containing protein [Encephalitozoon cuniculi EcunIII-L]UYI27900.1 RNA polymerase subunit [Encephalitozoon cuniculi]CAD26626.1 DNA-DIRECTED RNA POLYMERASE II 16kDa POLYPEPTIDE [Encephalitozoon cuniculi GB-M1]